MILMFFDYWSSYMVSSDEGGDLDVMFTDRVEYFGSGPQVMIFVFYYLVQSSLHQLALLFLQQYPDYKGNPNWAEELENRIRKWKENLDQKLKRLAQILHIDEILDRLPAECNQLIIVPYRGLHMLPFHALPIADNSNEETQIKTHLLDKFKQGVRYAPSCQLLKLAQSQQRLEFNKLVTIQDPRDELPFSKIEVESIRSLFPSLGNPKTHSDQQDLKDIHCIHFACHGSFNPNYPLESKLSRNPLNLQRELTLAEIFDLSLNKCRLVTLSACETGLTEPLSNSDEYITLASGFLYAGSPAVVSSLWTVDDISTALLMIKFYENLRRKQMSLALALNQAQLWLRDITQRQLLAWSQQLTLEDFTMKEIKQHLDWYNPDEKPFQDPYYWAPFCAIGEHSVQLENKIMISDPLLLAFPDLLENKPELFSTEDLQDLERTLALLENNLPENADEILRNWCKVRRSIRDELIKFSSNRKELGKVSPTPPIQQDRLSNWFQELRQQVKDKLKSESNKNNSNDL